MCSHWKLNSEKNPFFLVGPSPSSEVCPCPFISFADRSPRLARPGPLRPGNQARRSPSEPGAWPWRARPGDLRRAAPSLLACSARPIKGGGRASRVRPSLLRRRRLPRRAALGPPPPDQAGGRPIAGAAPPDYDRPSTSLSSVSYSTWPPDPLFLFLSLDEP
jgi:hypothetical protein